MVGPSPDQPGALAVADFGSLLERWNGGRGLSPKRRDS